MLITRRPTLASLGVDGMPPGTNKNSIMEAIGMDRFRKDIVRISAGLLLAQILLMGMNL